MFYFPNVKQYLDLNLFNMTATHINFKKISIIRHQCLQLKSFCTYSTDKLLCWIFFIKKIYVHFEFVVNSILLQTTLNPFNSVCIIKKSSLRSLFTKTSCAKKHVRFSLRSISTLNLTFKQPMTCKFFCSEKKVKHLTVTKPKQTISFTPDFVLVFLLLCQRQSNGFK